MSARDAALVELDQRPLPEWKVGSLRRAPRNRATEPADPRDRALAENIVTGVIKNLLLLQHLIAYYSARPLDRIDGGVQKILAIALYQLRFLTRIPASAAVDQAVEQARRFGLQRASGFVNAVLRNATREPDPALPDAETDPRGYATLTLSHPPELYERLTAAVGIDEALRICRHNQKQPPTIVRLSPGVTMQQFASPDFVLTPHQQEGCIVVEGAKQHHLASWAEAGLAQAQDPTSAAVVRALEVHPGQRVLDRCCGRGTKTLQLHSSCMPGGLVIAMDPAEQRLASLKNIIDRRGLERITLHSGAFLQSLDPPLRMSFDRILIDAPCSNSGVLARRPEARYRQSSPALASIARLQRQIFDDSVNFLAAGGRIAYSTCSIWPEENQRLAAVFLGAHPNLRKVHELIVMPFSDDESAHYHDGGYVVVLERLD